jgi:hypothetical protein
VLPKGLTGAEVDQYWHFILDHNIVWVDVVVGQPQRVQMAHRRLQGFDKLNFIELLKARCGGMLRLQICSITRASLRTAEGMEFEPFIILHQSRPSQFTYAEKSSKISSAITRNPQPTPN